MKMRLDRKLFLFGRYSLALLVPKNWLKEQGIEPGHTVDLEYQRSKHRIIIHLPPTVDAPTNRNGATKAVTIPAQETEWKPIPQL